MEYHPFYVYTYTSSLDGKTFYVGKGSDDRYIQHIREARRKDVKYSDGTYKSPTRVVSAVRAIWQQGGKVIIRKPYKGIGRNEALEQEKVLIVLYGAKQLVNQKGLPALCGGVVHNI